MLSLSTIIAIFLLLSSLSGNFAPSQNTWIQPIALIYPSVFVLNFIFFVYWTITKSKIVLIPAFVILVGFGNIFTNFQFTLFKSSIKTEDEIRLLSYNVQNFNEWDIKNEGSKSTQSEILDFLIDKNADIICLQEFHSSSNKLYEPLKDTRDTLNMESYYYESYFNPKHNQLLGLVTFSKYKAINKGKLKFKGSRSFGIYTDVLINRDIVRIFNIHLASIKLVPSDLDFVTKPDANNGTQFKIRTFDIYYKLLQAYKLREKQLAHIEEVLSRTKYKILLCGDFNDTPSSWVYNKLTNNLNDTFVKKGSGISSTYAGPIPFLRIDYILTSNDISISSYQRHNYRKSDHYPISSIIQLN